MNFDRRKALRRLNQQRRRFKNKGVAPYELRTYFGVNENTKFGDLDNEKLEKIIDKIDSYNDVMVTKEGYLYPRRYVKAFNIWHSDSGQPMVRGLEKALQSPLFAKDKTLADTKKRKNEMDSNFINLYAQGLENIGLPDIANKVKKMSYKNLKTFIERGSGLIDLNLLFRTGTPDKYGDEDDIDFEIDEREELRQTGLRATINKLWEQFENTGG